MTKTAPVVDVDFRSQKQIPAWVRDAIETSLAIESEDARSAGSLGFMARALVQATMPYKDPKTQVFERINGHFRLRMLAGYEGGLPYGVYPRLLMSWITTEAVKKRSPVLELGDSLAEFMREVIEVRSRSGGARGPTTRVNEQMKRLFGSLITATHIDPNASRHEPNFRLRNVVIADELDLSDAGIDALWKPQAAEHAGSWKSRVVLNSRFYEEIVERPVPIDLRAYRALRASPLAMDIYTFLTYRVSYLQGRSKPIPWERLMAQFGAAYGGLSLESMYDEQARRNFKKAFLRALKHVQLVYPAARVEVSPHGLVLMPSPSHVSVAMQGRLF